jgi:dipeptide transport system permease protein
MTDTNATTIAPIEPFRPVSGLGEFWYYFTRNKGAVLGLIVFGITVLIAILAPWIAPHPPELQYKDAFLKPPSWLGGDPRFFLGTDPIGRDILSRLMHGARYSLVIGAVIVSVSLAAGITLGLLAGYFRGWVDVVIMRLMDLILAFPGLLLALVLVAILGPGLENAMLAIAVVLQPHFARLVRGAVLAEKNREYVTSARLAGAGHIHLMLRTILPNCLAPLIVQATLSFSSSVLETAALGFLGLGAQPPTPEWGTMLATAREFFTRAPWVVTSPGVCILITVLAVNLIGDGLRDALDPKLKRS